MSAAMVETPMLVELERLRGAVGAQRARVAELEQAAQREGRELGQARSELTDHYRRRELGDDQAQDPGLEAELIERVRKAEGGLTLRPVIYPQDNGQVDVGLDAVNPRIEAQLAGARQLLAEREGELRAFVGEHVGDLAVERAPQARLVADRAQEALRVAAEAAAAYEAERTWWALLLALTVGEGETAAIDVPGNPFEGLGRGTVAPPMPERFIQ
jgi:hypothetical protein